ncbi:hypothetical protein [Pelagibius sp. Alg239-R121]|uniref:hypothetical protein n=1 Tax=Pelagibius sp. Alg239-R121 TaxID=2993448 RepID=UPI0024A69FD3|nr:hypothetical protein [Pelagibius sp. Alg239-R121]
MLSIFQNPIRSTFAILPVTFGLVFPFTLTSFAETLSPAPVQTATSDTTTSSLDEDDEFGRDWPLGPGRDDTGYLCSACHSLAIVKQQGLKRDDWDELLDWMVDEQGMDEPEAADRKVILDYLAKNFNIDRRLK